MFRHGNEIRLDARKRVTERPADLETAPEYRGRPLRHQRLRARDVLDHVVFRESCVAVDRLERPRHHAQETDLAAKQCTVVGAGRQTREVAEESHLREHHRLIRLLREQLAEQVERLGRLGRVDAGLELLVHLEIRARVGRLGMPDHPDRNARTAVETIDRIGVQRRLRIVARHRAGDDAALSPRLETMQNRQGQRIVDIVAHVGVENNPNRFLHHIHAPVLVPNRARNLARAGFGGVHLGWGHVAAPSAPESAAPRVLYRSFVST